MWWVVSEVMPSVDLLVPMISMPVNYFINHVGDNSPDRWWREALVCLRKECAISHARAHVIGLLAQ